MKIRWYNRLKIKNILKWNILGLSITAADVTFAKGSSATLGSVASNILSTLTSVTNLVTATSYVVGLGFAIGAIMKFKAHKENPQQVTLGTCFTFLLVAAALLFMPSILDVAGYTLFGSSGGTVAGPTGTVYGE